MSGWFGREPDGSANPANFRFPPNGTWVGTGGPAEDDSIFPVIDSDFSGPYHFGMWAHARARTVWGTAILAVLTYLALVVPMLTGFAAASHLATGAAPVGILCAEHGPVSGGSDRKQHDAGQHDTCCLFGCQFTGWAGFAPEAALVGRKAYARFSKPPLRESLAPHLTSGSPLPLGSRAPPALG